MEAMKEREKGPQVAKKWLVKLRQEFGRDTKLERDPDKKLKEPKEDTTYGYDDIVDDVESDPANPTVIWKSPPAKATRGRVKKKAKQKSKSLLLKTKIARARRRQSKFCQPTINPVAAPTIDFGDVIYQIGDVMKMFLEEEEIRRASSSIDPNNTLGRIVQIVGFHQDQFCEKYATVRWLILNTRVNASDTFNPFLFKEGPLYPNPINLRDMEFIMRINPNYTKKTPTHSQLMMKVGPNEELVKINSVISTLSSIDHHRSGPVYFVTE